MDFQPAEETKAERVRKMIFNSFLAGFISYVIALIYNLLSGNNLETVFLNGLKYLFLVPVLALLVQLSIYFIKTQSNNSDSDDKDEEENNKEKEETKATAEDFSPLNPPEIEYEDQKEK